MKASRLAAMLLLAVAMCVNFAACSDDGPEVPASITGTTLEGVDEYGYRMVVEVETSTGGEFSVYEPETNRLYYRMEDYIASRVALKNVLKDNSENVYREDILYYIAMSSYKYAHLSVASKQKDRYLTFVDDYLNFIGELPDSPYRKELDVLYRRAQKALGRPVDTSLFDDSDERDFAKERKKLVKESRKAERQNEKLLKESEADVVDEAVLDEEEISAAENAEKN